MGTSANYLNGRPYSDAYREIAREQWSRLPMYTDPDVMRALVTSLVRNPVTIVVSGTGSGKTVIVPKVAARVVFECLTSGEHATATRKLVAVTNPKKSTTLANATYAAKCMDVELGAEVGYHFRGAPGDSRSASTRVLYATDGMVLAQARGDPMMSSYACVIVDEAHERPPPVDLLLQASLRVLAERRDDFRLVIMSATIDEALFRDYFERAGFPCGVILARGVQPHAVRHHFLDRDPADYMTAGLEEVRKILIAEDSAEGGDILFFVPTSRDAADGCRRFSRMCARSSGQPGALAYCQATTCTELYSKASEKNRMAALTPPPAPYRRKLIFATNVAESSFTFEGLTHVVDSGMELTSRWDGERRCQVISRGMTSRAQATQRAGRVGRTGPGEVVHLYTNETFQARMIPYPQPSLLGMDLTQEVISMLSHGSLSDVLASLQQLITPPLPQQIRCAQQLLRFYGLLSTEGAAPGDARLSPLGELVLMAVKELRLSPWNALVVALGALLAPAHDETRDDTLAMALILEELSSDVSVMQPFQGQFKDRLFSYPNRDFRCSDHLRLLHAYRHASHASHAPHTGGGPNDNTECLSKPFWLRTAARVRSALRSSGYEHVLDLAGRLLAARPKSVERTLNAHARLPDETTYAPVADRPLLKILLSARQLQAFQKASDDNAVAFAFAPGAPIRDVRHAPLMRFTGKNCDEMETPRPMPRAGFAEQLVWREGGGRQATMSAVIMSPYGSLRIMSEPGRR